MEYAQLGRSGLSVSRICLGCMSYGSPTWRPWVLDEAAARPFFRRAIEAGINFFDTADMYSVGASEEVTGRALRELARREEIVLATKVFFPLKPGPNQGGLSRKHIMEACEASLRRLGFDTIDLYQIHRFDRLTRLGGRRPAWVIRCNRGRSATSEPAGDTHGRWPWRCRARSGTGGRDSSRCKTTTTCSTARRSVRCCRSAGTRVSA